MILARPRSARKNVLHRGRMPLRAHLCRRLASVQLFGDLGDAHPFALALAPK